MSFRHDKIRGNHPITPKKGIKEVDLSVKEKGNNDTIAVSVKPKDAVKVRHGDYETTYANGITYHQSKGKINYGTSRSHKSSETCLICEDSDDSFRRFPDIDEEYWDKTNAHIHWSLLTDAGFLGKQVDEAMVLNWNDLPQDMKMGLKELNDKRQTNNWYRSLSEKERKNIFPKIVTHLDRHRYMLQNVDYWSKLPFDNYAEDLQEAIISYHKKSR